MSGEAEAGRAMDAPEERREAILSMVRIGDALRRGDQAITDLADLRAAIDAVCPEQWFRLTRHCATLRYQRRVTSAADPDGASGTPTRATPLL